jgi:predicted small metal-binding protein
MDTLMTISIYILSQTTNPRPTSCEFITRWVYFPRQRTTSCREDTWQTIEREEAQPMVKEIRCRGAGIDCEFLIRSEQIEEMLGFVQEHASEQHDYDVSEDDLRDELIDI